MKYLMKKLFTPLCFLVLIVAAWIYATNEYTVGYLQGVADHKAALAIPHPTPPVVMPWMLPISQEEQAENVRNAYLELRKEQVSE